MVESKQAHTLAVTRRAILKLGAIALTSTALTSVSGWQSEASIKAPTGKAILTRTEGGTPVPGGSLTVAFVGGGAAETLDPNAYAVSIDMTRGLALFDRLTYVTTELKVENELADSFVANDKCDQWTLKLRAGVKFHDGSPLTADDVVFSLKRIIAETSSSPGKPTIESIVDFDKLQRVDDLTLKFQLKRPFVPFPDVFSDYWMVILKNGTADFAHPIGTGPFMYKEFSPGNGSRFEKNPHYWREGQPYLDELVFVSVPNGDARLAALKAGQVQAMESLTFTQTRQNRDSDEIVILEGKGPVFTPFVMSVNQAPFDDVRVRQAFRALVDREAMVNTVLSGFGEIGNDLYGKGLKYYATTIPQREQDIELAKSLLKEAGKENLEVTLSTSALWPAQLESAQVFAQQAAKAGVKVNIDVQPADQYFANAYAKVPFFQSTWECQPIATWMQTALVAGGLFNETHQDDPEFTKKLYEAQAETDPQKAQDSFTELQQSLWEKSGYIIWGFFPFLDGLSPKVRGAAGNGWNSLGGGNIREWWLAA